MRNLEILHSGGGILHLCYYNPYPFEKLIFLWQNGADVNAKDMLKMTALHWATEHHHRDVVELLIKYGADVHAFSKFDKSAFDIALEKNNAEILVILQVWFFYIPRVHFSWS